MGENENIFCLEIVANITKHLKKKAEVKKKQISLDKNYLNHFLSGPM